MRTRICQRTTPCWTMSSHYHALPPVTKFRHQPSIISSSRKYGVARTIKRRLKQEIQDNSGALDGAQGGTHDLTKARSGITIAFSKHREGTQTSVEDEAISSYHVKDGRNLRQASLVVVCCDIWGDR